MEFISREFPAGSGSVGSSSSTQNSVLIGACNLNVLKACNFNVIFKQMCLRLNFDTLKSACDFSNIVL